MNTKSLYLKHPASGIPIYSIFEKKTEYYHAFGWSNIVFFENLKMANGCV